MMPALPGVEAVLTATDRVEEVPLPQPLLPRTETMLLPEFGKVTDTVVPLPDTEAPFVADHVYPVAFAMAGILNEWTDPRQTETGPVIEPAAAGNGLTVSEMALLVAEQPPAFVPITSTDCTPGRRVVVTKVFPGPF